MCSGVGGGRGGCSVGKVGGGGCDVCCGIGGGRGRYSVREERGSGSCGVCSGDWQGLMKEEVVCNIGKEMKQMLSV